ncbi:MAG: sulfate/thiosulfate transport system permease protein [Thermoleophilaceae bacterium]|jgi:sulfate transport system permease protein|nr:sulfate/thiosulfate transport system permease protein [Thermoleophilaceae bacterium]MEA2622911.1 sulfate/thiosulfate transport system permease protein [Chloroflexota bacterium]
MSFAAGIRGRLGRQSAPSDPPPGSGAGARLTAGRLPGSGLLGPGIAAAYLGLIVLIPLAAVAWRAVSGGTDSFIQAVVNPQAMATLQLTLILALIVVAINAVMGTLIAWILVRDDFPAKRIVNALIDLPFALPTIVAGLTLLALYGPKSPFGLNLAYTQAGILLALLFVTLPFTVRAVQPVLLELDRDMEEAAASLGASSPVILRRIILPTLLPAILTGSGLGFARAIGEFGSVVLISGNIPFKTEVASVNVFTQIQNDDPGSAAAVSVVLLVISLVVLGALDYIRRRRGHETEAEA